MECGIDWNMECEMEWNMEWNVEWTMEWSEGFYTQVPNTEICATGHVQHYRTGADPGI